LSEWSRKLDPYLATTGMSKKQLAAQLGISINTLQKWWGNREPSPEYMEKIRLLLEENDPVKETTSDTNATSQAAVAEQDHGSQGKRYGDKSIVISFFRTTCPFCDNVIVRHRSCTSCGQHFVWANVPLEQ